MTTQNHKASKIITCILLTVFLSACGLEDYADVDRDGKTINCPELFEYQVYVHDFEDESNYSFTQCRVEINEEKKIVSHIDYWDAAHNIYEKLPILSSLIKIVKKKIQD